MPIGLAGTGSVLLVLAALQGGAQLAIVVFVPVIFGRSLEFVVGVLLVVAGLFTLPMAFESNEEVAPSVPPGAGPSAREGAGGLIQIGPVPIFFGSWRDVSTRTRVIAAIVGAVILAVVVLGLVLFRI